jgi:hypothetical protein
MDDARGSALASASPPPRTPLACGALGRYDRGLVARIAGRLHAGLDTVHEDRRSILMLDRPAIEWRAGLRRGFAWSEGLPHEGRIRSWEDAAGRLGACGLVVEPGRSYLHSSISGVAPVYFADCGGATYFASRIDPLVTALPIRFSADWRAWSTILCLRHAVDQRTPFAEVSRLPQFALLRHRGGRGHVARGDWPWAKIVPNASVEEGAPAVVAAMREVVGSLRAPLNCLLSGGRDSRLLLCLSAASAGEGVRAYTADMDVGHDHQERLASRVAEELGVEHALVAGDEETYWRDFGTSLARNDFQHVSFPRFFPLVPVLAARPAPVLDGLALDTLSAPGRRYILPSMLSPDGSARTSRRLFHRVRSRVGTSLEDALAPALAAAIPAVAKRQFVRTSRPFRGHPSEALLTLYVARTMRAISLLPHAGLGTELPVLTPFVDERIASACLSIRLDSKQGARLYRGVFERVNPAVGALASTNDPHDPIAKTKPRRQESAPAVRELERTLREGPLAGHLAGALRTHLEAGSLAAGIKRLPTARTALAVAAFHIWADRYASVLADPDPTELLELAPDSGARAYADRVSGEPLEASR